MGAHHRQVELRGCGSQRVGDARAVQEAADGVDAGLAGARGGQLERPGGPRLAGCVGPHGDERDARAAVSGVPYAGTPADRASAARWASVSPMNTETTVLSVRWAAAQTASATSAARVTSGGMKIAITTSISSSVATSSIVRRNCSG